LDQILGVLVVPAQAVCVAIQWITHRNDIALKFGAQFSIDRTAFNWIPECNRVGAAERRVHHHPFNGIHGPK
jgi:hypothetical protein